MTRKIVMLRPRDWLRGAFSLGIPSMTVADARLWTPVPGVSFEDVAPPIAVAGARVRSIDALRSIVGRGPSDADHSFMLVANIHDDEAEARFVAENRDLVEAVYSDPAIQPFPALCPASNAPIGTGIDSLTAIHAPAVHAMGATGNTIRVAIVDTGIDGTRIPVSGGWNLFPGVAPGMAAPDHGTMVAANVKLVAPNSQIYDCPLLQSSPGGGVAFISDAIRAYTEIMISMLQVPGPMVIVNSWGMYSTAKDAPVGHPQNYSANPSHPFNLMVSTLDRAGADVVLAAGNCGGTCPDPRCGANNTGPGRSIHGANSHGDALSVGAVTHQLDLLGYSSQGHGALDPMKPDLVAPSHYAHSGVYPADGGTSTACPVVGGAIAALRSVPAIRSIPPARIRTVLRQTAGAVPGYIAGAWAADVGYGVLNLDAALNALTGATAL